MVPISRRMASRYPKDFKVLIKSTRCDQSFDYLKDARATDTKTYWQSKHSKNLGIYITMIYMLAQNGIAALQSFEISIYDDLANQGFNITIAHGTPLTLSIS